MTFSRELEEITVKKYLKIAEIRLISLKWTRLALHREPLENQNISFQTEI